MPMARLQISDDISAYNNTNNLLIHQYKDKKTIYLATNYEDTTSNIRNIYNFENRGVDKLNIFLIIF